MVGAGEEHEALHVRHLPARLEQRLVTHVAREQAEQAGSSGSSQRVKANGGGVRALTSASRLSASKPQLT